MNKKLAQTRADWWTNPCSSGFENAMRGYLRKLTRTVRLCYYPATQVGSSHGAFGAIGQSSRQSFGSRLIVCVTHYWRDYHNTVVGSRFLFPHRLIYARSAND